MGVEVGQVLWRMRGIRQNDKIKWYAAPLCVEEIREHSFHAADGTGASFNAIGSTYFNTRQEAMDDFISRKGSLIEDIGIDDELSEEQRESVIERQRTDWNDKTIYRYNDGVNDCGVYIGGLSHLKDVTSELTWNYFITLGYRKESLTLREIYEQICKSDGHLAAYKHSIITVIQDDPLCASIYQCNNYKDGLWVLLTDKCKGYA